MEGVRHVLCMLPTTADRREISVNFGALGVGVRNRQLIFAPEAGASLVQDCKLWGFGVQRVCSQ